MFCVALAALVPCTWSAPQSRDDENVAAGVVILANSRDAGSLRIARHYAEVRGVPAANIVMLPMPLGETITWREFMGIWEPLMARLVAERWIDAIPMSLSDPVGRRKYAVHHHGITAFVVCRGVPLRIANDPALYREVKPFTGRAEFRTNEAAVDAEFALLAVPNHPINAFVPNPLYRKDRPTRFEQDQVVKVARLDGPTVDDALALVDHALAAEQGGLIGRAYVDIAARDRDGDAWLETTARQLKELAFDLSVDRAPATLGAGSRIDAPVLYFGWYANDLNGAFALPGFRFPVGAVALHIHSFSATTLHSPHSGWVGPLVARGVTATVGNVYEPYLQFTHRPDLLLRALARGGTLAEAAYYALPALSWQQIVVGDPLYRPFATANAPLNVAQRPGRESAYAAIREANRLRQSGRSAEADALLTRRQQEQPALALAFAIATQRHEVGDNDGAGAALATAAQAPGSVPVDEWGLLAETGRLASACGRPSLALAFWRRLLGVEMIPPTLRAAWLREAADVAAAANEKALGDRWKHAAAELHPE